MKKYLINLSTFSYITVVLSFVPQCVYAQLGKYTRTTDDGLVYVINDSAISIVNWKGKNTHIVIPDTIDGLPVKSIFTLVMFIGNQKKIKSLVLSKNLQELISGEDTNVDMFYQSSQLAVVEIPPGLDIKGEFSLPHDFHAWFCVHGRRSGTYTYNDGKWYLDGNPPSLKDCNDYAVLSVKNEKRNFPLNITSLNGLRSENFRIREKVSNSKSYKISYILPPGSNTITYSVGGEKYSHNALLEAGKYDVDVFYNEDKRVVGLVQNRQGNTGATYTTQKITYILNNVKLMIAELDEQ